MRNKCGFACNRLRHPLCCIYMTDTYDSLERLAHATGMTDLEYSAQQKELAYLARKEKILAELRECKESAPMPEVHQNHAEPTHDPYADYDYGYHDQYDF